MIRIALRHGGDSLRASSRRVTVLPRCGFPAVAAGVPDLRNHSLLTRLPPASLAVQEARLRSAGAGRRSLSSSPQDSKPESVPGLPPFLDEVLRGVGQVVCCNSAVSGALIGGGLLYGDPTLAVLAATGCASATLAARMAGYETSAGLMGYNGALVGCGFSVFLGAHFEPTFVATVLGGAASAFVAKALGQVLTSVPQYTLSFNLTALALLVFVQPLAKSSAAAAAAVAAKASASSLTVMEWCSSALTGVSQIFVVCDPIAGALMLGGIAAYSRGAALATLLGSVVGICTAVAMGADAEEVKAGLWGYNPALTALAVSIFFVPTGRPVLALAVGGSVVTAVAAAGMKVAMASALQVPAMTLPFCAVASACYLMNKRHPGLVLAAAPHSPEANWKAFRAAMQ